MSSGDVRVSSCAAAAAKGFACASVFQLEPGSERAVSFDLPSPREGPCMPLSRFIDSRRIQYRRSRSSSILCYVPHAASYECERNLSEPFLQR